MVVFVDFVRLIRLSLRLIGLDICFNATRHRLPILPILQSSYNMLWFRWSGASFLVGVYNLPDTPFYLYRFSFFSSLFAATKNFPSIIGIVSAASMVMYGLSPLFLSSFATNIFTDSQSGLNLTKYLTFLALACGIVNLFGACVLTVPESRAVLETADDESEATIDETTSLLSGSRKLEEVRATAVQEPDELSLAGLLRDPYFCVLFVFMSLMIGCVSLPILPRKYR